MAAGVRGIYKMVDVKNGGRNGRPNKVKLDIWDTAGQEAYSAI